MPITARGRRGVFSESDLKEAEKLGHIEFLSSVGVAPPRRGDFRSIASKEMRRRVWDVLASMSQREFDGAWQQGHIKFLADAWGCTPAYFRDNRGKPYPSRPGWSRTSKAEAQVEIADMSQRVGGLLESIGEFGSAARHVAVQVLNASLRPPEFLGGVFLPKDYKEQFEFMFVAEMPAMGEPEEGEARRRNFNFDVTERDKFLQMMMVKYGVAGSYVTDIVKKRDVPRRPTKREIEEWLPFLLSEIAMIRPRAIIVLGRTNYEASFGPFIHGLIPKGIEIDWVFHFGNQVPKHKFEKRFSEVMDTIRAALRG